jgi:hypothetical protein
MTHIYLHPISFTHLQSLMYTESLTQFVCVIPLNNAYFYISNLTYIHIYIYSYIVLLLHLLEISVNRSFHCRAGGHSHHSSSCISQERIESTELQNSSPIDIKNENNTRSTVHVEEEEIRMMIESLAKVIHRLA